MNAQTGPNRIEWCTHTWKTRYNPTQQLNEVGQALKTPSRLLSNGEDKSPMPTVNTTPQILTEEWRPIPSAPGYFAAPDGRLISARRKRLMLMTPLHSRDHHLYIFVDKKKRWVHHLILETFGDPRPSGLQCRHLDGDPTNNHINNLKWGTQKENSEDRRIHGTLPTGSKSASAKLTASQVAEIRALRGSGQSSRQLASRYNVSHTTIQEIWRGERWIDE